jgi:DnaJ-class molecular chaperone
MTDDRYYGQRCRVCGGAGKVEQGDAPVRYEKCFVCGGDGWIETSMDDMGVGRGHECRYCNGRGTIATEGGEV